MQKRAPNRKPPPPVVIAPPLPNRPHDQARAENAWRRSNIANYGFFTGINILQTTDSYQSIRQIFDTARSIESLCENGNIDTLQAILQNVRNSSDPVMSRPGIWAFFDRESRHFEKAYEHNHWHVIEFLARETPFHLTPLGEIIAERALQTNSTSELEKILDLSWDINAMRKRTMRPPTVR